MSFNSVLVQTFFTCEKGLPKIQKRAEQNKCSLFRFCSLQAIKLHYVISIFLIDLMKVESVILIDVWFGIPWLFHTSVSGLQEKIFQEVTITFQIL